MALRARVLVLVVLATLASTVPAAAFHAEPTAHIFGGTSPASEADAPWSVLVEVATGVQPELCSGSLIDAAHVLTAAHCVYSTLAPRALSSFTVIAGATDLTGPVAPPTGQVRRVGGWRAHPAYTARGDVDLVILTVSPAFDVSGAAVRPIAIVAPGQGPGPGVRVKLYGWGNESPGVVGREHALDQTLLRPSACASGVPSLLCGRADGGAACVGDSGGGLVSAGGTPVLVGVERLVLDSSCARPAANGYTDLSTPQVASWLAHAATVPIPPRTKGLATIVGSGVAGEPLTCRAPLWSGSSRFRYEFVDVASGVVLATGGSTYTPTVHDVDRGVSCVSIASSAGGTTEAAAANGIVVRAAVLADPALQLFISAEHALTFGDASSDFIYLHVTLRDRAGEGKVVLSKIVTDADAVDLSHVRPGAYRLCAAFAGNIRYRAGRACRRLIARASVTDLVRLMRPGRRSGRRVVRLLVDPPLVGRRVTFHWRLSRCRAQRCGPARTVRRGITLMSNTALHVPSARNDERVELSARLAKASVRGVPYAAGVWRAVLR
ncbi:S1 family peptidase [Baekduia sp.]|jgi:hypothetical protein|uniref:S1 family peptidase n=1 Tax=Baekduia sp. TaxID=2600305 RepID=UPI002E085687|nr:trypsin-like serine protease [Baekduia sp.]